MKQQQKIWETLKWLPSFCKVTDEKETLKNKNMEGNGVLQEFHAS